MVDAWVSESVSLVLNVGWMVALFPYVRRSAQVGKEIKPLMYVQERDAVRARKRAPIPKMLGLSAMFLAPAVLVDLYAFPVFYGWGAFAAVVAVGLVAFAFDASDGKACGKCGRIEAGTVDSKEPIAAEICDELDHVKFTYKVILFCPYCGNRWDTQERTGYLDIDKPHGAGDYDQFKHSELVIRALEKKKVELEKAIAARDR